MQLSDATLAFGEEVASSLLGLDALYRQESEDSDGLVVLNMDSGSQISPHSFSDYAEAEEHFKALMAKAGGIAEPDRSVYYEQVCGSSVAFSRWRSTGLDFGGQLAGFLHVPVAPASEAELDDLRRDMRSLLNGMGFNGSLSDQAGAWEDRHTVPPQAVGEVLTDLMSQAWDRTAERVIDFPAPKSDGMQVKTVSGVAFNARCNYLGRTVEINTDPTLTQPGLKHLAVHEGYPGHYLQFKLRETFHEKGLAPADGLLSVVNTASSSVFEGIADTGLAMIDWDTSDDDRLQGLMTRYRAAIGTVAAWQLHHEGRDVGSVTDQLRSNALTGGEGWVLNRMGFIEAPSRAVLIWSYWWGEAVVAPAWDKAAATDRRSFVDFLYGRMHSNQSVGMFN
ncbi:MAG: hypothetical protein ACR2QM_04790 [Longimicrobiales bacterium]